MLTDLSAGRELGSKFVSELRSKPALLQQLVEENPTLLKTIKENLGKLGITEFSFGIEEEEKENNEVENEIKVGVMVKKMH